jgi:Holliday junction resolvase RusA-like endonuclease
MQKLILPSEICVSLNKTIDLAKTHWSKYARQKKKLTFVIASYAKRNLKPVKRYPVNVHITWFCENRLRDPDNIASGKKAILDGLVSAGILRNDGWKEIKSFRDNFEVDKVKPRVEVKIV